VKLATRQSWTGWDEAGALRFTGAVERFQPDVTVLALGGASWPKLGADGAWAEWIGVPMTPFTATNCGALIAWPQGFLIRHAGSPLKRIALEVGGQRVTGEAVITQKGLEGGAIYALSRAIREGLARGPVTLKLDLRPDMDEVAFAARIAGGRKGESLSNRLRKAGLQPAAAALSRGHKIIELQVHGLAGLERAISSAGGVARAGLNAKLMLRDRPGVFVAGEMLDWEAPTGGYLLQGCFATGALAAEGALEWLKQPR
jgi:uncharacterized flavoprotein (TIGR03862 family)